MDIDESITVTKLNLQDGRGYGYLMIGWQPKSFEMYLYVKDKLWKGRFSANRLAGFSKNLNLPENDYWEITRRCLSQQRDNYQYEIKSGFFYWKRKYRGSIVMEGFLPMELDTSPPTARPDLLEIMLVLNKYLKEKITDLKRKNESLKKDYSKCLRDTEEFLNLKIEMEKALCDKFLNLLNLKKSRLANIEKPEIRIKDSTKLKQTKCNKLMFDDN